MKFCVHCIEVNDNTAQVGSSSELLCMVLVDAQRLGVIIDLITHNQLRKPVEKCQSTYLRSVRIYLGLAQNSELIKSRIEKVLIVDNEFDNRVQKRKAAIPGGTGVVQLRRHLCSSPRGTLNSTRRSDAWSMVQFRVGDPC